VMREYWRRTHGDGGVNVECSNSKSSSPLREVEER
jgi:hypothetical protein